MQAYRCVRGADRPSFGGQYGSKTASMMFAPPRTLDRTELARSSLDAILIGYGVRAELPNTIENEQLRPNCSRN